MFPGAAVKVLTRALRVRLSVNPPAVSAQRREPAAAFVRSFTDVNDEAQPPFDASLLRVLVCPLSKKPLRFDAQTSELINEELGIAYPVVDGIPNMIPQDARLVHKEADTSSTRWE